MVAARTLTVSSGAVTPMFRRDANGQIVQVEPVGDEYATPARGSRGRLQLSGISEVFPMVSQYSETPVEKIRVEYTMVKGANNTAKMVEGKRFTEIMTWVMGPKSTLGVLLGTLRGKPVAPGEAINPDDFIGTTFVATTTTSPDGKWGKVVPDAIEPDSIKLAPTAAPPVASGHTSGVIGEDDPFDEEV